ncbi:macro domain-containing protein [Streptomyces sp. CA2R106]|uniref:macro domain-containing protein n=1 Tax=Streptomyces sp. CA2R106 TaxID=3120153 RepID=UPI00300956C9
MAPLPDAPDHAPGRVPDHGAILAEVRRVRRAGLVRLRTLDLPGLAGIADLARDVPFDGADPAGGAVERVLRLAVARLDGGTLRTAAAYGLGLHPGTRDWPAADRRRRAAQVYGVSVERFRKHQELIVLGEVAEQVALLARQAPGGGAVPSPGAPVPATGPAPALVPAPAPAPASAPAAHRTAHVRVHGRTVAVTVHVHAVDLLRDVDVVVSPSNTYFVLPPPYKSSVSAALRRAGARRDAMGGLMDDRIEDELRQWAARHGSPGRAAQPGTVAVTSGGELARQGIRRIYHVALAVPRPESNDYEVQPADITRGVARALALLAEESARHDPPLRSVCLPLLGAGRGGLTPAASFAALWAAVEAELARGADWDVHLVVRRHDRADLLERLLAGQKGSV